MPHPQLETLPASWHPVGANVDSTGGLLGTLLALPAGMDEAYSVLLSADHDIKVSDCSSGVFVTIPAGTTKRIDCVGINRKCFIKASSTTAAVVAEYSGDILTEK